jgi:O-acetyl-ADP-ribose deacetylase (regulator of RNase III)
VLHRVAALVPQDLEALVARASLDVEHLAALEPHEPRVREVEGNREARNPSARTTRSRARSAAGSGVYGYPHEEACRIALREITAFLNAHPQVELVVLACVDAVYDAYRRLIAGP